MTNQAGSAAADNPPASNWRRWQRRLEQAERIGIWIDGQLVAVQEIRQRKVMLVEMRANVEIRPL